MRIILASKSPRRREILGELFDKFDIITAETDETLPPLTHPREGVAVLAMRKGEAVASALPADCAVISSDTLVEIDGVPLGKPQSEQDAFDMLRMLSGRIHRVHTGIAVHYRGAVISGTATSSVEFRELTDAEIRAYVATGEPMDKAGSYGIQGKGGALVKGYDGDFDTIVGLSKALTVKLLGEITDGEIYAEIKGHI